MSRSLSSITSVANRLKTGSSARVEVGSSEDTAGGSAGRVPELGRDWLVSSRLIRDRSRVFSDSRRDTLVSSWEVDWAGVLSCLSSSITNAKTSAKKIPDRQSFEKDCMSLLKRDKYLFSVLNYHFQQSMPRSER
jgi:hypothetical protein